MGGREGTLREARGGASGGNACEGTRNRSREGRPQHRGEGPCRVQPPPPVRWSAAAHHQRGGGVGPGSGPNAADPDAGNGTAAAPGPGSAPTAAAPGNRSAPTTPTATHRRTDPQQLPNPDHHRGGPSPHGSAAPARPSNHRRRYGGGGATRVRHGIMWDGSKDMGHGLRTGQVQVTGVDGQPEGVGWRSLGGGHPLRDCHRLCGSGDDHRR